jgi:ATP-dependent Clp endopeptidase proteolytic subunit ClpP
MSHKRNTTEEEEEEENEIVVLNNEIFFYSYIEKNIILKLRTELTKLINKHRIYSITNNVEYTPIRLYINSEGGELSSALSIVDLIERSDVPIHTIIEGEAASAATLISVVGHKRFITKNSHMLIHQVRGGMWGKMQEFEEEILNMKMYSDKLIQIYKKTTHLSEEKLTKILKKDILWDSKKCLKYGLVDTII